MKSKQEIERIKIQVLKDKIIPIGSIRGLDQYTFETPILTVGEIEERGLKGFEITDCTCKDCVINLSKIKSGAMERRCIYSKTLLESLKG